MVSANKNKSIFIQTSVEHFVYHNKINYHIFCFDYIKVVVIV